MNMSIMCMGTIYRPALAQIKPFPVLDVFFINLKYPSIAFQTKNVLVRPIYTHLSALRLFSFQTSLLYATRWRVPTME